MKARLTLDALHGGTLVGAALRLHDEDTGVRATLPREAADYPVRKEIAKALNEVANRADGTVSGHEVVC